MDRNGRSTIRVHELTTVSRANQLTGLDKPWKSFNRRFRLGREYRRERLDRFPSGELSERPKGGARRRADLLEPGILHLVGEVSTWQNDRLIQWLWTAPFNLTSSLWNDDRESPLSRFINSDLVPRRFVLLSDLFRVSSSRSPVSGGSLIL